MTPEEIRKKISQYKWEKWLERDFGAFIISLFTQVDGMKNIGLDIEMPSFVSQGGFWYLSHEVMDKAAYDAENWMKRNGKTIFDITDSCEKFYLKSKKHIKELVEKEIGNRKIMQELLRIFRTSTNYIWITHSLEEMYMKRLRVEIPKYWKGDMSLFIGDVSFPKKKNVHAIFEDKLRSGKDLNKLVEEFGWINIRNGFGNPFTVAELKELREKIKNEEKKEIKKVKVPPEIKNLVEDVRELVFFRTYRTDVFFELLFLARPILQKYGKSLGLEFEDMRNYRMDDLAKGNVKQYPKWVTVAQYKQNYVYFEENLVEEEKNISQEIKGSTAFMGMAKGIVRIVKSVKDLSDVKDGDILVTNMTTPNYLVAMKRAIAFVTDEGGITCHAAIIAREMRKPCIIGTKIATQVLKDGDMVEVDADKGTVKIIKK